MRSGINLKIFLLAMLFVQSRHIKKIQTELLRHCKILLIPHYLYLGNQDAFHILMIQQ